MGSALWYFDLTRSGSKVRQGWRWWGLPSVPFAIYCSAWQWPKVSGKQKSFQVPFVICNTVPQEASDDRCEFLLDSCQIEATANRFERIEYCCAVWKQLTVFKSVFTSLSYWTNKAGTKDNIETLTGFGFTTTVFLHIKIDPLLLWADSIPSAPKATDSNQPIFPLWFLIFADQKKK